MVLRKGKLSHFCPMNTATYFDRARVRERALEGHLLGEEVEDEVRGAAEVDLHDGAPGGALLLPRFARVRELEVYLRVSSLVSFSKIRENMDAAYF